MIELPDDFRDLLVELRDAGAEFVVVGGHADGITFDEAIAEGRSFELEGREIPVIGLGALLKNKRAAGRAQDLADVKALEEIATGRGPQ